MKKEQQQILDFISKTFGSTETRKAEAKRKLKSKRKVNTELRLKIKTPEEEIVKRNI